MAITGIHGAIWTPSPNFRPRKAEELVQLVIIHATWMGDDAAVLTRLTDPEAEVSCHYYITREGLVHQLVDEANVAWHSGKSAWKGMEGLTNTLNGVSLGIELANRGPFSTPPSPQEECPPTDSPLWAIAEPYTAAQYAALETLLAEIRTRYGLGPEAIVGHANVAPGRKSDPGAHFDWARLQRAGLALRP